MNAGTLVRAGLLRAELADAVDHAARQAPAMTEAQIDAAVRLLAGRVPARRAGIAA